MSNNIDLINITDIFPNFNKYNIDKKIRLCINKLNKIDTQIFNFEDIMFKMWDNYYISNKMGFIDKYDYYDYMTSTPKYKKLMYKKICLTNILYNF